MEIGHLTVHIAAVDVRENREMVGENGDLQ